MAESSDHLTLLGSIAAGIGVEEDKIRLVFGILVGYPLAFVHRFCLHGTSQTRQHLFFTITGLALHIFVLREYAVHSLVNIFLVYLVLRTCGGTPFSVVLGFFVNMLYLVIGFALHTDPDDFHWSIPHAILLLRLTSVVFDVSDGTVKMEDLSMENQKTALAKVPSLLELLGYNYFFGGCLVGPVLSMKRYQDFANGVFMPSVFDGKSKCLRSGLERLALGGLCLVFYLIGCSFFPGSFMLTPAFQELGVFQQLMYILLWGKLVLYKYVLIWLIAEGCCTVVGISYNGKDKNGNDLWNGCANIKYKEYEMVTCTTELVGSFHISTNNWIAKYVYKRLKWTGSKLISFLITMAFLALWHGLYPGYYLFFLTEFLCVQFEQGVLYIIKRSPLLTQICQEPSLSPFIWVLRKFYAVMCISYNCVAFILLTTESFLPIYSSVYFCVHVLFTVVPLFAGLLRLLHPSRKRGTKAETTAPSMNGKTE